MNSITRRLLYFTTFIALLTSSASSDCCSKNYCSDFVSRCNPSCCWAPFAGVGPVSIAPCYSINMLSRLHYRPIKPLVMLRYLQCNPCAPDVILSAQLRASAFYAHTNVKDKFGYLSRFPTNFKGKNASVADIHDYTFALTYSPVSWAHVYWEFLHSDHITFSTDPRQGSNHTQKIYALLGDFNRTPWYFTIGKKDVSFGAMYTVNPFTPSITWHYFGALQDGAALGYYKNGLYLEGTLLNGGRGIRVADTNDKGRLDNWAINGFYEYCCTPNFSIKVGGGYLYSTIYDGSFPEHEGPIARGPANGCFDINLEAKYCNLTGYIEYASTQKNWPATNHVIKTISGGASYCFLDCFCNRSTIFSVEYGVGIQGKDCTEFHKNFQYVAGLDYHFKDNIRLSFEYILAGGFAPLLNIKTTSKQKTRENVFQLGLTINI